MASEISDPRRTAGDALPVTALKILVAGGFGVGKTTMVGSVSEVVPLRTEEQITQASAHVDDLDGVEGKTTTTVALDFGRITLDPRLILYLFGTPGQERFWFLWDELTNGALGAIVLADTRRLEDCFGSVDFFERRGVPFLVGVNCFEGAPVYDPDEIRMAIDLDPHVPVVLADVRTRESSKHLLVSLVEHIMRLAYARSS